MGNKLFFKGIYGDNSIDMVRDIIHITPMEITGKRHEWYIKPHVHTDLFQIFVVESGSLELIINGESQIVESLSFFSIPKNIGHGLRMNADTKGWVISLYDKSLENMLKFDTDIINTIDEIHISKLDEEDKLINDALTTIRKCIDEYYSELPGKQHALQYLVGMMLLRLYRIFVTSSAVHLSDNKNKIYYRRFVQLIKEQKSFKISIEDYASRLNISSGHLNRICKDVSGLSPKDIVIDFFIDEAKIYLRNFDMSIAEISYELDIEDPAYFTRLFKKRTELTPKEFRNQLGRK
ncbi:AraC family transcriptional regulator [Flavobacterium granuli]|uniref:AraC family transcriptional regulator n=1 Tax=Flavobacterium granuli TaxID=280093 RepID=A0A1M5S0T9_9FLAO|nr:AraC family transcriptional regulator [Flavobacterium granuli]PRZ21166.1 AraC family transcriptional regulator [Flavobacterium granuli]SHH31938.1 transcriptional regulator, AraC family [Flavobacterium granuli]